MTNKQLTALLADPAVEKRVRILLRVKTQMRRKAKVGEESYGAACLRLGVTYAVLRTIKSKKKLAGERGFINKKELDAYMVGYKHKPKRPTALRPHNGLEREFFRDSAPW